jgi:fatty acid synthase subunit beta
MALTYSAPAADGTVMTKSIFPTIDEDTDSYTYYAADGLLAATQFTQPALTLMEKAIFDDLRYRGLVSDKSSYAGHSLGEYSALCAMGEVFSIKSLVALSFYRGLSMQITVERDLDGRSNYAMCAVDPGRVGKGLMNCSVPFLLAKSANTVLGFDQDKLSFVVQAIVKESKSLLEVVNYNVLNMQYVCAGEVSRLTYHALFKTNENLASCSRLSYYCSR